MFLIEADCEYDVWGSGYFGFRSVTGGLGKMTKFGKGAYLFSADRMLRKTTQHLSNVDFTITYRA
jgi:hypothetical protein